MTNAHILIIDDDIVLSEMLSEYLTLQGYQVSHCKSGEDALNYLSNNEPDLITLDIMMPGGMSGLETLPKIREICNTPVIMLTGRGDDIDKILGLEMGADDYLSKPCNPRELTARIQAVLRRINTPPPPTIAQSDHRLGIKIDSGSRTILIGGQQLEATSAEFDIFEYLLKHSGDIVSKEAISAEVLNRKLGPFDRSIDVHISHLRNKLKNFNLDEQLIKTVRGQGYQLIR